MNLVDQIFDQIITPYLEPRLKSTSLKALKGYVEGVAVARRVAITSFKLGITASFLIVGVVLMVGAVIALLPIDPQAILIGVFVAGAIMATIGLKWAYGGLNEKHWLKISKSPELIEQFTRPWEHPLAVPDPRAVFAESTQATTSPQSKPSATSELAHDEVNAHAPSAIFGTMVTPDAAMTTRP